MSFCSTVDGLLLRLKEKLFAIGYQLPCPLPDTGDAKARSVQVFVRQQAKALQWMESIIKASEKGSSPFIDSTPTSLSGFARDCLLPYLTLLYNQSSYREHFPRSINPERAEHLLVRSPVGVSPNATVDEAVQSINDNQGYVSYILAVVSSIADICLFLLSTEPGPLAQPVPASLAPSVLLDHATSGAPSASKYDDLASITEAEMVALLEAVLRKAGVPLPSKETSDGGSDRQYLTALTLCATRLLFYYEKLYYFDHNSQKRDDVTKRRLKARQDKSSDKDGKTETKPSTSLPDASSYLTPEAILRYLQAVPFLYDISGVEGEAAAQIAPIALWVKGLRLLLAQDNELLQRLASIAIDEAQATTATCLFDPSRHKVGF